MEHQTLSYQLPSSPDLRRQRRPGRRVAIGLVCAGLLALLAAALILAMIVPGSADRQNTPPSPSPLASSPASPGHAGGSPSLGG